MTCYQFTISVGSASAARKAELAAAFTKVHTEVTGAPSRYVNKRALLTRLAATWSEVTGEPVEGFALFLQEVPGHAVMEDGVILPEAADD